MTSVIEQRRWRGSAQDLHALAWPDEAVAALWRLEPERPAVVLGSQQGREALRASEVAARGLDVAERRSGGGAVLVHPSRTLWVDVLIPVGDRRWDDDLARTFVQVGTAWQRALEAAGVATDLWQQRSDRSEAARKACFAGRGWGELFVDGAKVLGLSQRRTRWGARVQCLWDGGGYQRGLATLLAGDLADEAALLAALPGAAVAPPDPDVLIDRLHAAICDPAPMQR